MTHEEKIHYMQLACGLVQIGFHLKDLDMLVSMYDLVLEKKGNTDLNSMIDIQFEVEKREEERLTASKNY